MTTTALVQHIETFALAGAAIFTVESLKTSNHYTYKVAACDTNPALYFVGVLTGPENMSDYTYLGTIRNGHYTHGRKSPIGADAASAVAFQWVWERRAHLPGCVRVLHAGRCARCARVLTVPESIASGFGPECRAKIGDR